MSSDHIIGQQPKYPKSTRLPLHAGHSEVRYNRHATNACQMRINYSWKRKMKWGLATLMLLLGIAAVFLFIDKDTEIEPEMTLGQQQKTCSSKV